ncbi:hypothetical protein FRB91_003055 [Serendipita sp. 411]|nr:hypothetical protein FRC18_002886 [Serendipita sp. 400]KAG8843834.1 hypothetical protein FRB91_003055 [Serendipita sp. 411]
MANKGIYVSSRIPLEIWWKIFEEIFSSEGLFATTYDGDDWTRDSWNLMVTNKASFKSADEQRKILRSVCKVWRYLSDTVGRRLVPIELGKENELTPADLKAIQSTWRVYLNTGIPPGLTGSTVQWRVLRVSRFSAKEFQEISYPHLRRLELYLSRGPSIQYSPDGLVDSLKSFTNITWFRYLTNVNARHGHLLENDSGQTITLPNLQVLFYRGCGSFYLPFYRLVLPSLRYLTVCACIPAQLFPLRALISAYGETLYSLCVEAGSEDESHPVRDNLFDSDDSQYFPPWTLVPRLRELTVSGDLVLKFHLLPPAHPLRTFTAHVWRMRNLSSWIGSAENLKTVRLLSASLDADGSFVRTDVDNRLVIIDKEEMEDIEATRGIQIKTITSSDLAQNL